MSVVWEKIRSKGGKSTLRAVTVSELRTRCPARGVDTLLGVGRKKSLVKKRKASACEKKVLKGMGECSRRANVL